MTSNQRIGLRAIMYSVVHALLVPALYNVGWYFVSGVMLGIWLIFWAVVFEEYQQLNERKKETERNER